LSLTGLLDLGGWHTGRVGAVVHPRRTQRRRPSLRRRRTRASRSGTERGGCTETNNASRIAGFLKPICGASLKALPRFSDDEARRYRRRCRKHHGDHRERRQESDDHREGIDRAEDSYRNSARLTSSRTVPGEPAGEGWVVDRQLPFDRGETPIFLVTQHRKLRPFLHLPDVKSGARPALSPEWPPARPPDHSRPAGQGRRADMASVPGRRSQRSVMPRFARPTSAPKGVSHPAR
jgi:hypothetical protein